MKEIRNLEDVAKWVYNCSNCKYSSASKLENAPCAYCRYPYTEWKPQDTNDEQTAKADAGKLDLTLVPTKAIRDCAIVREYGNRKYGSRDNWKQVSVERYTSALYRHLLAFIEDPHGVDEESGIQHYKHLLCNACFISALMED